MRFTFVIYKIVPSTFLSIRWNTDLDYVQWSSTVFSREDNYSRARPNMVEMFEIMVERAAKATNEKIGISIKLKYCRRYCLQMSQSSVIEQNWKESHQLTRAKNRQKCLVYAGSLITPKNMLFTSHYFLIITIDAYACFELLWLIYIILF